MSQSTSNIDISYTADGIDGNQYVRVGGSTAKILSLADKDAAEAEAFVLNHVRISGIKGVPAGVTRQVKSVSVLDRKIQHSSDGVYTPPLAANAREAFATNASQARPAVARPSSEPSSH